MISAIVLAAGKSTRMGTSKLLLPWAGTTIIGHIITELTAAGISDIHLVVGEHHQDKRKALEGFDLSYDVNLNSDDGEMLTSVKTGIKNLPETTEAVLIVLGDQPLITSHLVRNIITGYSNSNQKIIVPSYRMHRGHPWLVESSMARQILDLKPPQTLRDFLGDHEDQIDYLEVDEESVIQDMDTPTDYADQKPQI